MHSAIETGFGARVIGQQVKTEAHGVQAGNHFSVREIAQAGVRSRIAHVE